LALPDTGVAPCPSGLASGFLIILAAKLARILSLIAIPVIVAMADAIIGVAFSPDDKFIVVRSRDGTMR
jgi:hypothetical protein